MICGDQTVLRAPSVTLPAAALLLFVCLREDPRKLRPCPCPTPEHWGAQCHHAQFRHVGMEPSASLIILGFLDASHIYLISPSRPALPPINRAADFELCFLGPLASTWQALKAAGLSCCWCLQDLPEVWQEGGAQNPNIPCNRVYYFTGLLTCS